MRIIALIILIMCTIIEIHGLYRWEKSLRQREQMIRKAERTLARAVILQNEQIKATQHLLNGQKMRYFTMNKQALEIEKTLEEVKDFAGSFKRKY